MSLSSYLPQSEGLLPKWQLLVAGLAVFNTVQCFATTKLSRRVYNSAPLVTDLQARTFAVWTLTSAIIRLYAAYNIHDKNIYDMAFFTYLIAFGHFVSEILVYRTAKVPGAVISSCIVATTSLVWMFQQYSFYVKI